MLFLDTDVLIELSKIRSERKERIKKCIIESQDYLATTSLNYEEFLFGYLKYKHKGHGRNPLGMLKVYSFNKKDAELAAKIEVEMEKKGVKKPRVDVMIASIVINNDSKLFTLNKKHYREIKGLKTVEC